MTDATASEVENSSAALHRKMDAEIAKLVAETSRINNENRAWPWVPLMIAAIGNAGVTGVVAAAVLAALHR
jgi:L-cystine uptake protein TcyP (sodium:dicarboxylate symporter family)